MTPLRRSALARMYPSELSNRTRNDLRIRGEVKMYDALARGLTDDWTVFYNVAWQDKPSPNARSRDGETDFIVAHPDLGALVLEVKGGTIGFKGESQQWTSTSSNGNVYNIDPFGQVRRNKYSLIDYVLRRRHAANSSVHLPIYDAVAFPECERPKVSIPEAPREMTIDGLALGCLEGSIRDVFAHHRGNEQSEGAFGKELVEDLVTYLAPNLQLRNPLALAIGDEREDYVRLTERQFDLLHALRRKRRLAVSGCAGSGKTMLAMEKARRLAETDFRTLLTCLGAELSSYLSERAGDVPGLTVGNLRRVARGIVGEAGIQWRDGDWDALPDALIEAVEARPELKFDAILVDEGQDFDEMWWIAVQSLLADEGESIFYVFFDDNQRVYGSSPALPSDLERWPLDENVRNTRAIFEYVEYNYGGDEPITPRGPSGRTVELRPYHTDVEMKKVLGGVLQRLLQDEHLLPSDIVVLTPNFLGKDGESALAGIGTLGPMKVDTGTRKSDRNVLLTTIQEFKGREDSVVIVCELDDRFLARENALELAYVACSRPQHHLILVGQPAVLDILSAPHETVSIHS